jgi:RNA polymerase sigma factor (sigma-70 family)
VFFQIYENDLNNRGLYFDYYFIRYWTILKILCSLRDMENILAIKNGEHAAFVDVYHAYHVKVFRFYLKRVMLPETAKDLTQQCFIRLWEFRHTLSTEHALEKQLFVIARSILINHLKKAATLNKLKVATEETTTSAIAHFEVSDQLKTALEQLPPVRRKILTLKLVQGYTNKEIAEHLFISVKTVEDHVNKAFKYLKQEFGGTLVLLLILSNC